MAREENEKTPVLPAKKSPADGGHGSFTSTFGLIMSCLGCSVGTGNIWRFNRMVALNSGQAGGLCFLLPWLAFLFLWSIPMLLVEYSAGRYTKKGVVATFHNLSGPWTTWCGTWVVLVSFLISAWYHVVSGWCIYYVYRTIAYPLSDTHQESQAVFNEFAIDSYWPLLTQAIALLLGATFLTRGAKSIQWGNTAVVPVLLVFIAAMFVWSLCREGALNGVRFLFTPDWATLKSPRLWMDAASQNAFDCGAGWGEFMTYAAFMTSSHPIVKYSVVIPIFNNLISLLCGTTTFATAFSSLRQYDPNITDGQILDVLQTAGPGSTGLTFIWYPVLFAPAGTAGRVFAAIFFLCLVLAAISSLVASLEVPLMFLEDLGVPRVIALPSMTAACYLVGVGSALNLQFLANQDLTWAFGLLISGIFLQVLVIRFGVSSYRDHVINTSESKDWKVPKVWEWFIKFVAPAEVAALLLWWVLTSIIYDKGDQRGYHWYEMGAESLMAVFIQWLAVMAILIGANALLVKLKPDWFMRSTWSGQSMPLDEDAAGEMSLQHSKESSDDMEMNESR